MISFWHGEYRKQPKMVTLKSVIRPYMILAALALSCNGGDERTPAPEASAAQQSGRVLKQLIPTPHAVRFCEELADVVTEESVDFIATMEEVDEGCYVERAADFVIPVNEFYHKAGTVFCRYQDICNDTVLEDDNSSPRPRRDRVSSIEIEEFDVGSPDNDFRRSYDEYIQNLLGQPLKDIAGNLQRGVDGILDVEYGGTMYGGRWWRPEDNIFYLIHKDYLERMEELMDQLRAGLIQPATKRHGEF